MMTFTHAMLFVLVLGARALAVAVNAAALLGWLRRRWRKRVR
jgi:hypothetical protein